MLDRPPLLLKNFEDIQKEITCNPFIKWIPAKNPKEHEDMSIVETVKAETAAARAEEQRLQEQWRNDEIERQREWREQDIEWREGVEDAIAERHRETLQPVWWGVWAAVGVGVVSAIISVIAIVMSASKP